MHTRRLTGSLTCSANSSHAYRFSHFWAAVVVAPGVNPAVRKIGEGRRRHGAHERDGVPG